MSDIQAPNGFEVNEALAGTDEMEVYQPASGGVRRNKRALLSVLKTFFQTITLGAPENGDILTSTGADLPQSSGVKLADVQSDIVDNAAGVAANAGDITSAQNQLDDSVGLATGAVQGVGIDNGPTFNGGVQTDGTLLRTKIVDIGDWDMVLSGAVDIPHGFGANYKKIRSVSAIVRDDDDSIYYDITIAQGILSGGVSLINSTDVRLTRVSGAVFTSASFDQTSYNRGWITITYEA